MDVREQKVSCTSKTLLIVPYLGKDVGRMIAGYLSSRKAMAGSAAYSLTQRTAHEGTLGYVFSGEKMAGALRHALN